MQFTIKVLSIIALVLLANNTPVFSAPQEIRHPESIATTCKAPVLGVFSDITKTSSFFGSMHPYDEEDTPVAYANTCYDFSYLHPIHSTDLFYWDRWYEDNNLLSGTSSYGSGEYGFVYIDFGSSYSASTLQVTSGGDGLGNDLYYFFGSDDTVSWTQITIPTGWTVGSYSTSISCSYRYYQFDFSDTDGFNTTSLPKFNIE